MLSNGQTTDACRLPCVNEGRIVGLAMAAGAGLVAGGVVPVGWALLGPIGAVVCSLVAGFIAGMIAGTHRRAVVSVAFGALPAAWIDLVVIRPPPRELGGFVQTVAGLAIIGLAGLALVGGALGVAAGRHRAIGPVRSSTAIARLAPVACIAATGWLWFALTLADGP
jgi:hypothetical protein